MEALDRRTCRLAIVGLGYVGRRADERYHTTDLSLDLEMLGENQDFLSIYKDSLRAVAERVEPAKNSADQLFLHTAFPVRKSRLASMKERLRDVVMDFIDVEQEDDGDHVQKLIIGFYT